MDVLSAHKIRLHRLALTICSILKDFLNREPAQAYVTPLSLQALLKGTAAYAKVRPHIARRKMSGFDTDQSVDLATFLSSLIAADSWVRGASSNRRTCQVPERMALQVHAPKIRSFISMKIRCRRRSSCPFPSLVSGLYRGGRSHQYLSQSTCLDACLLYRA